MTVCAGRGAGCGRDVSREAADSPQLYGFNQAPPDLDANPYDQPPFTTASTQPPSGR
jgi:hypothetical protein